MASNGGHTGSDRRRVPAYTDVTVADTGTMSLWRRLWRFSRLAVGFLVLHRERVVTNHRLRFAWRCAGVRTV
jgi:ribosomal protein L39E